MCENDESHAAADEAERAEADRLGLTDEPASSSEADEGEGPSWTKRDDCGVCGVPATRLQRVTEDGYSVPRCDHHYGWTAYQAEWRLLVPASELRKAEEERDKYEGKWQAAMDRLDAAQEELTRCQSVLRKRYEDWGDTLAERDDALARASKAEEERDFWKREYAADMRKARAELDALKSEIGAVRDWARDNLVSQADYRLVSDKLTEALGEERS
jgi:hypothetical protein